MSTRSAIGKVNNDGTVNVVYCHYDGYPEGVGACLSKAHNCTEDADHILELGSLSHIDLLLDPIEGVPHSFDNECFCVTVAYHRDRGEKLDKPTVFNSIKECVNSAWDAMDAEYVYLWNNHRWNCWNTSTGGTIDLYKNI